MRVSTFFLAFDRGGMFAQLRRADSRELSPELKRALYVSFLFFSLIALIGLYWAGFFRGPYIDDNSLIFSNEDIRAARAPWPYWYRGQAQTKAWPLTRTMFWLLYQIFHARFWAYRSLNVLLHWAAGVCLFHFLARKVKPLSAAFAACFFWYHPVAVDSVTWISQLGTLITVLFLGWWIADLEKEVEKEDPRAGIGSFLGMVLAKGFAYLLPLALLRKRLTRGPRGRAFLVTVPTVLIAAYGLFLTYVGVYQNTYERSFIQSYYGMNLAVPVSPGASAPAAEPSLLFTAALKERLVICGKTFIFYVARFVSFSDLSYPGMTSANLKEWDGLFMVAALLVFALFGWALLRDHRILLVGLLLYLPVSGFFYMPFLKYGMVSDHLIYPAFFVFAWGVGLCIDRIRHPTLRWAYWLWPALLVVFTTMEVRAARVEFPVEVSPLFNHGSAQ